VKKQWGISFKIEQWRDTMATISTASNLAKETEGDSTAGSNRTCSDGRSREDKCGDNAPQSEGKVHSM